MHDWLHTFSGKKFNPLDPKPEDVCMLDVAHALAMTSRFSGHGSRFYCPTSDQRVLTDKLEWVPAGDLTVGTGLVGFDEHPTANGAGSRRRKFRPSRVTHIEPVKRNILRLEMSDGSTTTATEEHPWLLRSKAAGNQKWETCATIREKLSVGRALYINKFVEPWSFESSRDGGWLAGIYDGEGYLTTRYTGCTLGVSQKPGVVLQNIERILHTLDCEYSSNRAYKSFKKNNVCTLTLRGGWRKILRLLGKVRPIRLLDTFSARWENHELTKQFDSNHTPLRIVSCYDEGHQWVPGIETSTHTYLCEGYAAHNSVATHSVYVSKLAEEIARFDAHSPYIVACSALEGLIHDASEFVLCDVPSPIKHAFSVNGKPYKECEREVTEVIRKHLKIPEPTVLVHDLVKYADCIMLGVEARALLHGTDEWHVQPPPLPKYMGPEFFRTQTWQQAKSDFLLRLDEVMVGFRVQELKSGR